MQPKRYHVIVSGTEFFLDVVQTADASDVPYVERQEHHKVIWNQARKSHMLSKAPKRRK